MAYCSVCEFTPSFCGRDPMACHADELYAGGACFKVLRVNTQVKFWGREAGIMTQYHAEDCKEFHTKAEAIKYISDLCDLHKIG